MPLVKKPMQGFKIDGRVSIAMDALSNKEKKVIGGVLSDRDHFIASTSDPRKVRKLSESEPVYALSGPSGLNIIYRVSGDEIEILDLMGTTTLERLSPKRRQLQPKAPK